MGRNNASTVIHRNNEKCEGSDVHVNDDIVDEEEEEEGIDTTATEQIHHRDEVGDVQNMSSKYNTRLRLWRIVVTSVILLTAFAVTFTTYTLLKQQEDENFKTAVGCCS